MTFHKDDAFSLFDSLRGDPDEAVEQVIVTTYSVDLVALVGLVLTLGGAPDEGFQAGPLALVEAFRRLKGKLIVLCQRGRIVAPRRHHHILKLLDGMVREIPCDERNHSWHPKLVLVRRSGIAGPSWRLWIGSRNLTGTRDREAGVTFVSTLRGGRTLTGLAEMARGMLAEARLSQETIKALADVRWLAPPGVRAAELLSRAPGSSTRFFEADATAPTLAISPFIDETGLTLLSRAGGAAASLLTTQHQASQIPARFLAPPAGLHLRVATSPEPQDQSIATDIADDPAEEHYEPPRGGLHAKLIARTRGRRSTLWIGSANLTRRGLNGPNAEVMARLEVEPAVIEQLRLFFEAQAFPAAPEPVDAEREAAERALDVAVQELLGADFALRYGPSGLRLTSAQPIDAFLAGYTLQAWLFTLPDARHDWPASGEGPTLYPARLPTELQTRFISFSASSRPPADIARPTPQVSRTWTLKLELPEFEEDMRDAAALAAYIGHRRLRAWLAAVLEGITPSEMETWACQPRGSAANPMLSAGGLGGMLSLEHVLACWARNPEGFEARVAHVDGVLRAIRIEAETKFEGEERNDTLGELAKIAPFWTALAQSLRIRP